MVSGQGRYLPQRYLGDVPPTPMVLLVLATRYTSDPFNHELVLNNVRRYFDSGDDILCHQGKACVYRSCTAGEERVKGSRMLKMV